MFILFQLLVLIFSLDVQYFGYVHNIHTDFTTYKQKLLLTFTVQKENPRLSCTFSTHSRSRHLFALQSCSLSFFNYHMFLSFGPHNCHFDHFLFFICFTNPLKYLVYSNHPLPIFQLVPTNFLLSVTFHCLHMSLPPLNFLIPFSMFPFASIMCAFNFIPDFTPVNFAQV